MKLISGYKSNVFKRLLCLSAGMLAFFHVSARKLPEMKLDKTVFNVGHISEDDKPVSAVFKFTNTGDSAIVITKISTTCGCITYEHTKGAVLKGKTGEIKINFNPKGLPGKQMRTILVHTNLSGGQPAAKILLTGDVERTSDPYPAFMYKAGELRLRRLSIDYGIIKPSAQRVERISVVNSGSKPLRVTFVNVPRHMECFSEPACLEPGQEGDLVFRFRADKLKRKDRYSHEIYLDGVGKVPEFKRAIKVDAEVR